MSNTNEEIIHALQVIEDECNSVDFGNCPKCKLYVFGHCGVKDTAPNDWKLNINDKEWKAFI
jgi:hypothetical protein